MKRMMILATPSGLTAYSGSYSVFSNAGAGTWKKTRDVLSIFCKCCCCCCCMLHCITTFSNRREAEIVGSKGVHVRCARCLRSAVLVYILYNHKYWIWESGSMKITQVGAIIIDISNPLSWIIYGWREGWSKVKKWLCRLALLIECWYN